MDASKALSSSPHWSEQGPRDWMLSCDWLAWATGAKLLSTIILTLLSYYTTSYTVRNEEYLIKAGNHFKTIPHYKVTNSARIQMKYIYRYIEK